MFQILGVSLSGEWMHWTSVLDLQTSDTSGTQGPPNSHWTGWLWQVVLFLSNHFCVVTEVWTTPAGSRLSGSKMTSGVSHICPWPGLQGVKIEWILRGPFILNSLPCVGTERKEEERAEKSGHDSGQVFVLLFSEASSPWREVGSSCQVP